MKTLQIGTITSIAILAMLFAGPRPCFGQTNLNFTGISSTSEGAIQLTWNSTSNEVYEIDEADSLLDTNTGAITWNKLYDDYPSQGTNTFWLDTGNYNISPQILNPKYMPARFYRIVSQGFDTLSDTPTVAIAAVTNNTVTSGEFTFTVTAATDQPGLHGTTLYVDGQEMQSADSITNYTVGSTNYETDTYSINTCEWFNGNHILFATAEVTSQYSSQENGGPILTGRSVSPFVTVLFNNLVEEISFSQPSFDPSQGQIQQINAYFALDSDWTLNVTDINSNIVYSTNGSGSTLNVDWDGTGTGGTNLSPGVYFYYISAATNNETPGGSGGGSGGGAGSPPSPDLAGRASSSEVAPSTASIPWARPSDGVGIAVPLILYPPGYDTNGFDIFEAPENYGASEPSSAEASASSSSTSPSGFASPDYTGPGSPGYVTPLPTPQATPPSPQRPPNNPVRGLVGTVGVAADTYAGNGTNGPSVGPLLNGLGLPGYYIAMQGSTAARLNPPRPEHKAEVSTFVKTMQYYGWNNPLIEVDSQLNIADLRGSGSKFNNVNFAIFLGHGTYGTSIDYTANQCKQMYYTVTSGASAQYLRLSEMNMGGSGTNGLKWMVLDQCYSLYQANWNNMQNAGVYPYNGNMHLILGANSETWTGTRKWYNLAKYMNFGSAMKASPLTIRNSYYQGNYDAFQNAPLPSGTTITLAIAGGSACMNDSLQASSPPGGTWSYDSKEVYPLLQ